MYHIKTERNIRKFSKLRSMSEGYSVTDCQKYYSEMYIEIPQHAISQSKVRFLFAFKTYFQQIILANILVAYEHIGWKR